MATPRPSEERAWAPKGNHRSRKYSNRNKTSPDGLSNKAMTEGTFTEPGKSRRLPQYEPDRKQAGKLNRASVEQWSKTHQISRKPAELNVFEQVMTENF